MIEFPLKYIDIDSKDRILLFPNHCNAHGCVKSPELHALGIITVKGDFLKQDHISISAKIPLCLSHANDMRIAAEWKDED